MSVFSTAGVDLSCCHKITDTGLHHVAQLTQLTSLNVGGCDQIMDTGLEHLARLMQLSSLDFARWPLK